jgi:hypothetical protein
MLLLLKEIILIGRVRNTKFFYNPALDDLSFLITSPTISWHFFFSLDHGARGEQLLLLAVIRIGIDTSNILGSILGAVSDVWQRRRIIGRTSYWHNARTTRSSTST